VTAKSFCIFRRQREGVYVVIGGRECSRPFGMTGRRSDPPGRGFFLYKFRANCPCFNIADEIALTSPEPDAAKAEAYFERALAVARQQQAKSWELRAAISLARLWRDQGKVSEARELLAPVYEWFTEGFDTRDLKEPNALLGELGS
jgi:hypothetical protein